MWTLLILTALLVKNAAAIQWSSALPDNAQVNACVGGNISLPWSFTTDNHDIVIDINWYFTPPGGTETAFASYFADHLFADRPGTEFLPPAGLLIREAAVDDSGTYAVHVNSHDHGAVEIENRTAHVLVAVPPAPEGDRLSVRLRSGAVKYQPGGQWALELECGQLTSLGQPPVTVTWTDPDGFTHNSSSYVNGTFVLILTDPVTSGDYSCQLSRDAPAAMCVDPEAPLSEVTSLYVDGKDAKITLLEARERELLEELKTSEEQTRMCEFKRTRMEAQIVDLVSQTEHGNEDLNYRPESCVDVQQYDNTSGVHTLFPTDHFPISVFCDQTTDGGGWTVFQRRMDGTVDFYRNWTEYQLGFGIKDGEYWLGLENLHEITSTRQYEMRVDLEDWEGHHIHATYSGFLIGDSVDNYRLHFDSFTGGTAGDSLSEQKGMQFSTKDADHDVYAGHCATQFYGAWWYNKCHHSNLNGQYKQSSHSGSEGIIWSSAKGQSYSFKVTEMKLRPM